MPAIQRLPLVLRAALVAAAFAVVCPLPLAAQDAAPATGEAAKPAPRKKSLFETIKQGGIVMPFIGLASVFTVYLVIDIYLRTSTKRLVPPPEVDKARQFFLAGDYVACYQSMKETPCGYNNCVKYALASLGKGKEQTEEAIVVEVGRENARLQNRINYLSVIGVCSPMIGLLGTVVGMMGAFTALGESGAGDTSKLSEHIGEVLVATASGLFIAIPAFMFFYILRNRLSHQMHTLEDNVNDLFRNTPYEYFHGTDIGQELTYAALPNWVTAQPDAEPVPAQ